MSGVSVFVLLGFVALSAFVGGRLMMLARTGHRLPALSIGLAFLLSGAIGFPLLVITHALPDVLGSKLEVAQLVGFAAINLGSVALWIFTWRTFRPSSGWAIGLVVVAFALMGVSFFAKPSTIGADPAMMFDQYFWIGFVPRALSPVWAAAESLHYHVLMRRRAKLGLADPVLTNRFLLWGLASLATAFMSVSSGTIILLGPDAPNVVIELLRLASFVAGIVSGIAMWLAFFPPSFYTRRLESTDACESVI